MFQRARMDFIIDSDQNKTICEKNMLYGLVLKNTNTTSEAPVNVLLFAATMFATTCFTCCSF